MNQLIINYVLSQLMSSQNQCIAKNEFFIFENQYNSQLLSFKLFEPHNESTDSRIVTQTHNLKNSNQINVYYLALHCNQTLVMSMT
jgi:hypothetical protein